MKKFQGIHYYLQNIYTQQKIDFLTKHKNKVNACQEQGLKAEQWKVLSRKELWSQEQCISNLTKAQLLKILENLQDNEEVQINVEYTLWNGNSNDNLLINKEDGLCYDKENKTLHIFAGDFDC